MEKTKLTLADMRAIDAAYRRGEKHAMERLGDGAMRLRKHDAIADHDKIEGDLRAWLNCDNHNFRAPGVRENLFRLSDYLSGRLPVPPREVLLFLHAYIFALEGVSTQIQDARQRERETRGKIWQERTKPPRMTPRG